MVGQVVVAALAGADTLVSDTTEAGNQPVEIHLETYVESTRVPLNREVRFHVRLSWIGPMGRFQIDPITQPHLTNLVLQGSGSSNKLEPLGNGKFRAIKTLTYLFRPLELGMAYIDPMEIHYRDRMSGQEHHLQSQRVAVEIIEPVAPGGGGVRARIYVVLLAIFFLTIAYFLWRFIRLRSHRQQETPALAPPSEEYLKKIAQEIDPKASNLGPMSVKLSQLFREFLSREFSIPAREASSSEIVQSLGARRLPAEEISRVEEILTTMDRIKFAGVQPGPVEFSQLYQAVETFIEHRQQLWQSQQSKTEEV
ncbi:MAG: hypothetical protein D6715_04675 [Calditrichaeota bacterium]|nr:MAG: hypothetical protein D6715_04675 [Calditrichota bacterium]